MKAQRCRLLLTTFAMVSWFVGCASDVVLPYNLTGLHTAPRTCAPFVDRLSIVDDRAREDRSSARAFCSPGPRFGRPCSMTLARGALDRMTEVVARHLHTKVSFRGSNSFAFDRAGERRRPVLDGRVSRFRGYVQSKLDASVASDRWRVDGPEDAARVG